MKHRRFQRGLALLLAAGMALPGNLTAFAEDAPSVTDWADCTACSEDAPHMISTKADLDHIRTHLGEDGHVNGYFKLANDIVFEKADFKEGGDFYRDGYGWLPIGDDGTIGTGHDEHEPAQADIWLDGGGHTISGLEMHSYPGDVIPDPRPAGRDLAFVSRPGKATIQNLSFDDINVVSRYGGAVVYGVGTADTVVKNVTVTGSTVVNMGWKVGRTALFARAVGGLLEDITVRDCLSTTLDGEGNSYGGWGQSFFVGQFFENATLRNITVEDCRLEAYAYSTLFVGAMKSGVTIDGVDIRNLEAKWTHHAIWNFAGEIWDGGVPNLNANLSGVSIRNVRMDAGMEYGGANYAAQVLPEVPGIVMEDSVLVYRQNLPIALTAGEGEENPREFENVYLVTIPEDGARTILYCAKGSGQSTVAIPESLNLSAGETYAIPALPGGTVSYKSSDAAVSVSDSGVITAEANGSAIVTVMVKMADSAEPAPLAEIAVTVGDGQAAADKSGLRSLYDAQKDKENAGYTAESWNLFQSALVAALAVLNNDSADQAAVDKAKADLEAAAAGLVMEEGDLTHLTIDGAENAVIYLPASGGTLLQFAAQELQENVQKISGAELPIAGTHSNGKLEIVLATPDTVPEIAELFADDLAAIGELDGFAVRTRENRIYILSTNERGVQNGVYDFLSENAGIIWTRASEDRGTLYNPQDTIAITTVNYREIPDIVVRGMIPNGEMDFEPFYKFSARNKMNSATVSTSLSSVTGGTYDRMNALGIQPMLAGHMMSNWLPNSKYFDEHPEYYLSNPDGTPKKGADGFTQLNFYNRGTAEAVAYEICEFLKVSKEPTVGLCLGDSNYFVVFENGVELTRQPFTADNGVTVYPEDENYKSTVFYNFLNRVAKIVGEQYPDVKINTLAYIFAEVPPAVDIAENINIIYAPLNGDDHLPIETSLGNTRVKKYAEGWSEKTKNLYLYSYWECQLYHNYPRPIAKKVQEDLHYLKNLGFLGIAPEGDGDTVRETESQHYWDINGMYFWMIRQLFWDMDADLDALKTQYCDLAYGPASAKMQEFYNLIEEGWNSTDDFVWYITGGDTYYKKFIIDAGVADKILETIQAAYDAAETDLQRERILPLKEIMEKEIEFFKQFPEEDGKAYYSDAGEEAITSFENLSNLNEGPWADAVALTQFRTDKMTVPARPVEVRLLWDEENLYVAYVNYDTRVGTEDDPNQPEKITELLPTDNWFKNSPAFMETYLCGDANQLFDFRAYYSDAKGNAFCYLPGIEFDANGPKWNAYYGAHTSENEDERYWVNLQVVPFADMGVTASTARLYGTFVSNSVHGEDAGKATYYGWCGANVWSTASFRPIELFGKTAPADLTKLTIDGEANAEIYVAESANSLVQLARTELQDFVKKISGAELPALSAHSDGKLEIVLATPDTVPEIAELFADDLAWIGDTDGFAVRTRDNRIYILANEGRGVLNGVYDFLEENAGILWTRGVDELGTLYTETPTIEIVKADYREKSPFYLRGWNACGQGATGQHHIDVATRWFEGRNKLNARVGTMGAEIGNIELDGKKYTANGHILLAGGATLPIDKYFEDHPEYFMTNADGTPKKSQYGSNLNFYNLEAADAVAQEIYDSAVKNKLTYVSHSIQDNQYFCMVVPDGSGGLVDLASQPFTADNGVTVTPDMDNYKSTVFFNFLNRAARKLKEMDPELKIVSLAYIYCEYPPAVDIEDNIVIQFAPIYSDDHLPIETAASNATVKKNLTGWAEKTKNIVVYNYYASLPCAIYSRPIAEKVQKDFQFYADLGLLGLTPEGGVDSAPGYVNYSAWSMNHLYYWLMDRLMWDPYADLDALTVEFCDKAYGEGSAAMQEYYRLIQSGWDMFDDYVWYTSGGDTYIKKFIIDAGIAEDASKALADAYAASDELGKKRIKLIQDIFEEQLAKYANFVPEDGFAYRTDLGKDTVVSQENMTLSSGPWSKVKPLTVFKNPDLIDCPRGIEVRLMWDDDNVYVAYKVPNEKIGTDENPYDNVPPLTADGSWWNGGPEFMETYLCGNMTNMSEYSAFYTDAIDQQIQYNVGPAFAKGPYAWESHSAIHAEGEPEERYWMNVLVIPFETLGVTSKTATLGGTFVANVYGDPGPYYGWCGSNVWSTASFRLIKLVDGSGEPTDKTALKDLCDSYENLENDGYTEESWNAFQEALAKAKDILADENASQAEADEAKAALEAAAAGLTKSAGSSGGSYIPSSGWIQLRNGNWKYRGENGRFVTGWQKIKNIWYYLDDSGIMLTGWQKIDGVWYYLKDWGGMATGWQKVNGVWYYLKSWGGMATGWLEADGVWYYLKDWGGMASGWMKVNGVWYYFYEWGGMAAGTTTPDGYRVDPTGAWVGA